MKKLEEVTFINLRIVMVIGFIGVVLMGGAPELNLYKPLATEVTLWIVGPLVATGFVLQYFEQKMISEDPSYDILLK